MIKTSVSRIRISPDPAIATIAPPRIETPERDEN